MIEDNAPNVDVVYSIVLATALEQFTIVIDRLLERKGTATHLNHVAYRLFDTWSGLDAAMSVCPRDSWEPPVQVMDVFEKIRQELGEPGV